MTPELVRVELRDEVAEIILDSPPVNAFSEAFLHALLAAVRRVSDTRAVAVVSALEGMFAAGGDIPFMAAASMESQIGYLDLCQETYRAFEELSCPVVAAIDGACLGGGLELALACDIRIAGSASVLGLPEATIGLIAGGGAIHRLERAVGQTWARDLLLTGRRLTATEALAAGVVSRVADTGRAREVAWDLARSLAAGPTQAIAATKRLLLQAPHDGFAAGLAAERVAWVEVRQAPAAQEGLDAFTQKRAPDFRRHRP